MKIIFCEDPLHQRQVDSMFLAEAEVTQTLNIEHFLISYEDLVAGSPQQTIRRIPHSETVTDAVYRGWMLKPNQYQQLYEALLERNVRLINSPAMYRHCHYLPESYPVIAAHTPKSVWIVHDEDFSIDAIHSRLEIFGNEPIIVKDYVKSQKHYWHDACYIPNAADRLTVERVVLRFLELQGDDLNEGLVFREFVEFQPLTQHSRSAMPLTQEYRVFVIDGRPIFSTKYWSEGDYPNTTPDTQQFETVMKAVNSRFFTMDIAKRLDGDWMIVELGDGQVSGLPDHVDITEFYQAMLESWPTFD